MRAAPAARSSRSDVTTVVNILPPPRRNCGGTQKRAPSPGALCFSAVFEQAAAGAAELYFVPKIRSPASPRPGTM